MKNDIAYNNLDFIPGGAEYPERWEADARAFREREAALGRARLNHPYGPGERQKMDVFHPAGKAEGLVVFIHGGYWHRFHRDVWSHFSSGLTERGFAVAMPSYTLAPQARIRGISREVARAVEAAAALIAGPVLLTGHSAGGHLVARLLCRDILLDPDVRARIRRAVPISPLSDLRPFLETSMNATLGLDADEAESESPVLHPAPDVPVTVWVGAEERPAFLDQARWLVRAWGAEHRVAPGRHHFDVIDDLQVPESPLIRTLVS